MLNEYAIYKAGVYLRLSKEDGDNLESESIINQRKIIREYISKREDIIFYEEYVDDGYSGANFNRPNFKRMLNDIKENKINMVITKSLSRFGRNYIESGEYIEKIFPDSGVRYIAIIDNIDNYEENSNNDFMPIKAIFNEKHCKDTSISVKKTKRSKMQEGFYCCNTPPFGYKKDILNPGNLLIDDVAAKTVRKIFQLKSEGFTQNDIVKYLEKHKYQTPAEYLKIKGLEKIENKNVWRRSSVNKILSNKVYLGHCVRGKTQNISYKTKRRINVKRNELIIVPNTHEAIIDEDIFYKIHNNNKYGQTIENKKNENLLKDLIYCKNCGKKLIFKKQREKIYVYCRNNDENSKLCSNETKVDYGILEQLVFKKLIEMYQEYFRNKKNEDNLYKKYTKEQVIELEDQLSNLTNELNKLKFKISSLYNDRLSNAIDEEIYKQKYALLIKTRVKIQEKIKEKEEDLKKEKLKIDTLKSKKELLKKVDMILNKKINSIDLKQLINSIEIQGRDIYVYFKFSEPQKIKI